MMRILLISIGCFCVSLPPHSLLRQKHNGKSACPAAAKVLPVSTFPWATITGFRREVLIVRDRGIHQEELPVVFFLAQRARVSPEAVVDLRLRGMNWMDITLQFGLSPDIYYVPVKSVKEGPPYGNAYGYYKKHPKKEWKKMKFKDEDIVNQVNLKFISEHHKYTRNRS